MVHVPIDTGCTHRMPVSILHTHIITAIAMAMAGSSSVVEAVLHVLVVPGLIVATSAAATATTTVVVIVPVVGVVQMVVRRKRHPGPVPGCRPARVRPP